MLCAALVFLMLLVVASIEAIARDDTGIVTNETAWRLARALLAVPVLLYFALFLRTGQTLGMRALDFYVRCGRSGRRPGTLRSASRAVLAVVFAGAAYVGWFGLFTDPPAPDAPFRRYFWQPADETVDVAVAIAITAIAGKLWSWVDRRGRSVWDLLFGLAYVEHAEREEPTGLDAWLAKRRS